MITKQSKRLLPAEQRILQAASVAGMEFSTASVAAALEADVAEVEEWCAGLADRQHFLRRMGISRWPDGTVGERYGFLHALYQHLWHERVGIERRRRLHLQIGERQEAAYGNRTGEIAAELAVHFEEGRDYQRAVRYLQQAAENAVRRYAHQEAVAHLTKSLELLSTLPDTPARVQQELSVQTTLGPTLMVAKGYAAPEVLRTYARARELCQQVGETPQLFSVLVGLCWFYSVRAENHTAYELGEQILRLAQRLQDPDLFVAGYLTLGILLLQMGELIQARAHLEQGLAFYDSQQHHVHTFLYGQDPRITHLSTESHILWLLGYPEQARRRNQEALALSQELAHPPSLAFALSFAIWVSHCCKDWSAVRARAKELRTLATEQEFSLWSAQGSLWEGWLLSEQGQEEKGLAQISQTLPAWQATGAELGLPFYLSVLAKAYEKMGQMTEGLSVLAEALARVDRTGERYWEAELYRLKGELLLKSKVKTSSESKQVKTSPEYGVRS